MAIYTQRQDLVSFPLTMKKDEGRIKCVGELISIWYFFTCPSFTPGCPYHDGSSHSIHLFRHTNSLIETFPP